MLNRCSRRDLVVSGEFDLFDEYFDKFFDYWDKWAKWWDEDPGEQRKDRLA